MRALLDTSVLIAGERGANSLDRFSKGDEPAAISAISVAEYWKGVERAKPARRREQRVGFFNQLIETFEVVDVDTEIAKTAARVWAELESSGSMVGAFDLIIAATALTRDWALATADVRDFRRIEGLRVIEVGGPDAPVDTDDSTGR